MNFISSLISGSGKRADSQSTLLEDWNSYSQTKDVESGGGVSGAAASSSDSVGLFGGASRVTDLFSSASKSASAPSSSASTLVSDTFSNYSIPTAQQLMYFFSFLAAGCVFLILAFLIFLPIIIVAPAKFALSFTLGCLCVMGGFGALRGWKQQLTHMISKERRPFSAAYFGSIVATFYAALILNSYLLSLFCSGLQMVALLYYILSYFPGGAQGVKFMLGLFYNASSALFASFLKK